MAGAGEVGPPSPSTPRNTSKWGGRPSVSSLPPPTAPNKRRSPLPQGPLPTPTRAVHSVVSAVLWLRGQGVGEVAHQSQLDSGSDLGLLVHPGTHSLCHLFF